MRYTGFKTDADIMRPAANEIAARMSIAPTIRHQRRHKTEPFKACDVWNEYDLKTVFDYRRDCRSGPRGERCVHMQLENL